MLDGRPLHIVLSGADAETVERKAAKVLGYTIDLATQHAMTPNLRSGKTEVLFSFRGPGSRAMKTKYFGAASPATLTVLCEDRVHEVHIAKNYVHLGGLAHHGGWRRQELARRAAIAHQAFGHHRRLLFCNNGVDLSKRAELSIIMSKLLYNSESWVFSTQADWKKWVAVLGRLYRRFLRLRPDERISNAALAVRADMPDATTVLRRSKLRYLGL